MQTLTQMKRLTLGALLSIGLLMGCNPSSANTKEGQSAASAASAKQAQQVQKDLERKVKDLKIQSVTQTAFGDLYEVVLEGNQILYTNGATSYTLAGHLFDNATMNDVTQQRMSELSRVEFKTLPLDQSFKLVKGDGKRVLAVFEDPNCGYCKVLRKTLEQVDNITLYTFAVDILGPQSTQLSKQLLCANDPAHAWDAWMLKGTLVRNAGTCDTSVLARNKALAQKIGVTGTPAIVFANGKLASGALDKASLEQALSSAP